MQSAWRSLDRDDLNYATSYLRVGVRNKGKTPALALMARGLADFFGRWARAAATGSELEPATYRGRVLAVVASRNQRRVVDAIVRAEGDGDGEPRAVAVVTKSIGLNTHFPLTGAYAAASRHVPSFLAAAVRRPPALRRAWAANAAEYALTTGLYVAARRWLASAEPAALLVSNDHMMRTRVFVEAARAEGIPTIYVQHASVTARFPPLRTDIALLDGVAAAATYLTAGPSTSRIFLTGSPLHDRLFRVSVERSSPARLGVCLNLLDQRDAVVRLVSTLASLQALPIEVRTHPRDERPWSAWLAKREVAAIRNARQEDIEAFLARVSVVVAGDSNVHLEAALAGVPSVSAGMLGSGRDGYGFVKAGIVPLAVSESELRGAVLNAVPATLEACRRFDATAGTSWAGRAGFLIRGILGHVVRGAEKPPQVFSHATTIGGTTVHALDDQDLIALGALHSGTVS